MSPIPCLRVWLCGFLFSCLLVRTQCEQARRGLQQEDLASGAIREAGQARLRGAGVQQRLGGALPVASAAGGPTELGCANVRQGRHLVVDDRGFVCSRASFNGTSGCCHGQADEERFQCSSCDLEQHCCSQYEYCVACCMSPSMTSLEDALSIPSAQQPIARPFGSVFDLCRSRCRSNSQSVVHENAYRSELHHCYRGPSTDVNGTTGDGEPFKVEVASPGQSCADACAERSLLCVSAALKTINTCEWLRQFFTCDGGCSTSAGQDQPAEVLDDAPASQRPGACLVNNSEDMLTCDGRHPITRRLCPCASAS